MKAMQVAEGADGLTLRSAEMERPRPGPGEIVVRVCAAGVTTTELLWYPTTHAKGGEQRQRAVPGHEFSGVIAEVGEQVQGVATGQEIYGMNDWFAEGAIAEYCLAKPGDIAPKPATLTHEEAATVPIGGLTAWQGLFDRAKLQPGERVLVHGGAGAVGLFAVQLAHLHGAHVIATTSAKTLSFVRELGADEVIDFKAERFEEKAGDVDVIFDTVGGDTRERSRSILKAGGRLISIAADSEVTTDPVVRAAYFIVEPNQEQLVEVAKMLDGGTLKTFVNASVPLEDAAKAFEKQVEGQLGYGKFVVRIQENEGLLTT
jgi:NADPH:quinone reductase-like Zn-dependent oxidoreductase